MTFYIMEGGGFIIILCWFWRVLFPPLIITYIAIMNSGGNIGLEDGKRY